MPQAKPVLDTTVAWANSEAVNTLKTLDLVLSEARSRDQKYLVIVSNPSTETAIAITFLALYDDGGTNRRALVQGTGFTVAVSKPEGEAVLVEGILGSNSLRLVFDNTTVIGAGGAFTARVQVWRQ